MAEILDYLRRSRASSSSRSRRRGPNAKNARILTTLVGLPGHGGRITRYALRNYEITRPQAPARHRA